MKKLLSIVLALAMMLSMVAVSAVAEDTTTYTKVYASEYTTLNYLSASTQWDQEVGANVIDTLIEYDNRGNIVPGLAESWETSEDGLTWTFHLRDGLKWYDYTGAEVADLTAQDFVDALKYVCTPAYESGVYYVVEGIIANASAYYEGEITDFAEVGVKALDDKTVQYTLSSEAGYFLSELTYGCFMPAYGPQLEELGADFGTDNTKMYYCGAYILSDYEPQYQHVYVKNTNNWDADNIYIETIVELYNSEANTLAPTMALVTGETDSATLDNDILDEYLATNGDIVTRSRAANDYSYFYCFNFDPQYDEEYGPDNWRIAVNNSNFRHSIMSALNRSYIVSALEPDAEEAATLLQNTITPRNFAASNSVDFADEEAFAGIEEYFYDTEKALAYKEAAVAELTEAGATFPVTIVLTYRPDDSNWENECFLLKQSMEELLGTDYINIVLYAGPTESFLSSTRRAGVYSLMRCNWGADYADPETWTDPFSEEIDGATGLHTGNSYNKMDMALDNGSDETKAMMTTYYELVNTAKNTVETVARYDAFAEAEAYLIENAFVIPYKVTSADYQVTKLNVFEGQFSSCGVSVLRYKGMHKYDHFITVEEYEANKAAVEQ